MKKETKKDFANPYEADADGNKDVVLNDGKQSAANAIPLGLLGFGMPTILLNLYHEGFIDLSVVIVAMGFAAGGLMQIIAGIFEMKRGNTFGGTAFTAYGCFWWSLIFIWLNPSEFIEDADEVSMGFYLALWGAFTLLMFIASLRHSKATQVVFLTLAVLFFGLAAYEFLYIEEIAVIVGYVGIFSGGAAIYNGMGLLLNEEYGREVFKLGNPSKERGK